MDIRERYGVTLRISDMVSVGMKDVIDGLEKLFNIDNYKNISKSFKTNNTKTVIIPDDVHMLIVKKQIEIKEKYGISMKITDMVTIGMKHAIDKIERLFNLGNTNTDIVVEPIKIQDEELILDKKQEIVGI